MTVSKTWAAILGAIVSALLAAWKLPAPLNDIIRQIIDALVNNPSASGLGVIAAGLAGYSLWQAQPIAPEDRDAADLFRAIEQAQLAATRLNIDVSAPLGELVKVVSTQAPAACEQIRAKRRQQQQPAA